MIFVDLDECLIRTDYDRLTGEYPKGATSLKFILRPGALTLLASLRELGPTRMLTMGIREYAHAINQLHSLGFDAVDIFAREDYCRWTPSLQEPVVHTVDHCPGSILIDNTPAHSEFTEAKLKFLGITADRLIVVPHFTNRPDEFRKLIPEIVEAARTLLKK